MLDLRWWAMLTADVISDQGKAQAVEEYFYDQANYYFDQADGDSGVTVFGKTCPHLGLSEGRPISREIFRNLLLGKNAGGAKICNVHHKLCLTLSFAAPKSVSLRALVPDYADAVPKGRSIWSGLPADPAEYRSLTAQVAAAHDEAVLRTMRKIEDRCAATKMRDENDPSDIVHLDTHNLVWAVLRDGYSREWEPHLHSHCILFNMTAAEKRGATKIYAMEDGRVLVPGMMKLYGAMYRMELRRLLHERGFRTGYTPGGFWRVHDVSIEAEERFSSRRRQILAAKAEGYTELEAWDMTRKDKDKAIDKDEVRRNWSAVLAGLPQKSHETNKRENRIRLDDWSKQNKDTMIEARQEVDGRYGAGNVAMWQNIMQRATERGATASVLAVLREYYNEYTRQGMFCTMEEAEAALADAVARRYVPVITGKWNRPRYTTWSLMADERRIMAGFRNHAPKEKASQVGAISLASLYDLMRHYTPYGKLGRTASSAPH